MLLKAPAEGTLPLASNSPLRQANKNTCCETPG
jgi:hypothetical protein